MSIFFRLSRQVSCQTVTFLAIKKHHPHASRASGGAMIFLLFVKILSKSCHVSSKVRQRLLTKGLTKRIKDEFSG